MNYTDYVVHYSAFTASWNIVTKVKKFKTEAARTKFLDKLEEAGTLKEVLAYGDPS